MILLDIMLDAVVVPAIIQSDSEFANSGFEELCMLLGSHQVFFIALRLNRNGLLRDAIWTSVRTWVFSSKNMTGLILVSGINTYGVFSISSGTVN